MPGSTVSLVAIGGYTPNDAAVSNGPTGLTTWWWDGATGVEPAGGANLPSPSFACWHPTLPVLYAVSELDTGVVTTLAVDRDGRLAPVSSASTGGAQPCGVTTDPAGHALLIANYGSGSIAVFALDADGMPIGEARVVQHHGSGPVADRQDGPHVHQLVPTAAGTVLASDLGTDRITEYRIDESQGLQVGEVDAIAMPAGSGPRHIALAAGGATGYVTGELDGTVTTIRRGDKRWAAADQVASSGRSGAQPSHLQLVGDDRWLLVANRGPDTLAVLDVAAGLTVRDEVPTGATPRHFAVVGETVLVACQDGGEVDVLTLDAAGGTLTRVGRLSEPGPGLPWRQPSCVAPRPRA
jgi:6-phosphogluconolactonase (cycloisomerase 2 family)